MAETAGSNRPSTTCDKRCVGEVSERMSSRIRSAQLDADVVVD
jgi:hypothetical protein